MSKMEKPVSERIKLVLDKLANGNKAELGRAAGVSGQAIADLIGGQKGGPSFSVLQKILRSYPEVDEHWFLFGEGQMFKKTSAEESTPNISVVSEPPSTAETSYQRGKPATHNGQVVPTFRRKAASQPPELPGSDLLREVARHGAEIERLQETLEVVVAELRQLNNR